VRPVSPHMLFCRTQFHEVKIQVLIFLSCCNPRINAIILHWVSFLMCNCAVVMSVSVQESDVGAVLEYTKVSAS